MKRTEFIKYTSQGNKSNHTKKKVINDLSVTDPTFARTGRQMIFQPLNIEYRMKYPEGVPLDKDNPFNFKEYDKMYPDTFKAIRQAEGDVKDTKSNLKKLNELNKPNKQPSQQTPTPVE